VRRTDSVQPKYLLLAGDVNIGRACDAFSESPGKLAEYFPSEYTRGLNFVVTSNLSRIISAQLQLSVQLRQAAHPNGESQIHGGASGKFASSVPMSQESESIKDTTQAI